MNVCVRTCALQQRQGMSLTPFSDFHPHQTLALMPSVTWLVKTKPWCALDVLLPPICCPANEVVTLICHHPRLFWLTFPFTDWNHTKRGALGSAVITLFCFHTQLVADLQQCQKSNLDGGGFWQFDHCGLLDVISCLRLAFRWLLLSSCCVSESAEISFWLLSWVDSQQFSVQNSLERLSL